jgi:hypothetical protein
MGSVGKTLFGVATQDDINQIIQHIRKFETLKASITTDTSEIMQTMHSLYSALDKRQSILKAMTDNLRNSFDSLTTDIRVKLVTLIGMGALQYETLLAYQTQLLKEQAGINRLYAGYLPMEFVSPTMVQRVLDNISNDLAYHQPGYRLTYRDVQHYYHLKDIAFCTKDDHLYIMIKIPISRIQARMDLYRLIVFPIAYDYLPNSGVHYDLHDKYLAITTDQEFYLELSTSDYLHGKGEELKKCPYSFLLRETAHKPSCAVVIFQNNLNIIKQNCDQIVTQHKDGEALNRVLSLSNGSYLISSQDTEWTQVCAGELPQRVPNCRLCIFTLSCDCLLKTKNGFTVLPTLSRQNPIWGSYTR